MGPLAYFWSSSMFQCGSGLHSFLLLSRIPLNGHTTFCLSIGFGRLDFFHFLAVTNNVAMKVLCKSLCVWKLLLLLDRFPGVELLGHTVSFHLHGWGTGKLFSKVIVHFTSPPAGNESSSFFTSSSMLAILCLFDDELLLDPLSMAFHRIQLNIATPFYRCGSQDPDIRDGWNQVQNHIVPSCKPKL